MEELRQEIHSMIDKITDIWVLNQILRFIKNVKED